MDTRTRRDKLAAMAAQSASPEEAAIARVKLDSVPPPRTLSRDQILGAPDTRRVVGSRRLWDESARAYVVVDIAEVFGLSPDDVILVEPDLPESMGWASPHDWDGVE